MVRRGRYARAVCSTDSVRLRGRHNLSNVVMAVAILASTPALHWAANQLEVLQPLPRRARDLVASALTFCVFLVSASFVVSSTYNPFIYFRF